MNYFNKLVHLHDTQTIEFISEFIAFHLEKLNWFIDTLFYIKQLWSIQVSCHVNYVDQINF